MDIAEDLEIEENVAMEENMVLRNEVEGVGDNTLT